MPEITETFRARTREAWRRWLARHHAHKQEVWLILFKRHVSQPSVGYAAAVEEALCFGWIDSTLKRIDADQHVVRFGPRRARSIWSESNKRRVARLVREGRMTAAGMAAVEAAKRSGEWRRASGTLRPRRTPPDLARALARNQRAREGFAAFPPSARAIYVGWVLDAKREETRRRRVREVVRRAAKGLKPGATEDHGGG